MRCSGAMDCRHRHALWHCGLALLSAAALFLVRSSLANELRQGSAAPEAVLVTLDGEHISTRALRGRVVILTFWASYCTPCREELPLLSRYYQLHRNEGLEVLGFSLDDPDDLAAVRRAAAQLSFPVGLLARSSVPGYGRIWRMPVSFTIDRDGKLVQNGWKDKSPAWTAARLEEVVTPLLSRPVEPAAATLTGAVQP